MVLKNLSIEEFTNFEKKHPLSNYCQSINYAIVMSEYGYDYDIIGLVSNEQLLAATLILTKKINNYYYGYCPKGYLIDYTNTSLLKNFTDLLHEHYEKKKFVFIKINPEIATGIINPTTFITKYNDNLNVIDNLTNIGYFKLKNNLYFESLFPRFTGIIPLDSFEVKNLSKNTRNKIKKAYRKGLVVKKVDNNYLKYLNKFSKTDSFFYKDFYNTYSKSDQVDFFIITIDTHKYLEKSQKTYENEADKNHLLNEKMISKSHARNINKKMNSDIALLAYKKDIMEATKLSSEDKEIFLAAALVVKNNNSVKILKSAYNTKYKRFVPNYFLYYNLIKYYSKTHNYLDLNGLSGDFTKENIYYGLNNFKLGFNPKIVEFIGEFDLIINSRVYKSLIKNGSLAKEFQTKY